MIRNNSPFLFAKTVLHKPFKDALQDIMRQYPNITNSEAQQALREASIIEDVW